MLKELIANDRDNVFLNLDDFGEIHNIEGNDIICIIDQDGLLDRQGGAVSAVGQSTMTLYAKVEDLPERRGYGSELTIDGIPYMIDTWYENMGLSTINLFITMGV